METFLKDGETFAGRPSFKWGNIVRSGSQGFLNSEGPKFRETKKFTLQVFRDFGLGRNLMQEKVLAEVTCLIKDLNDEIIQGMEDISFQKAIELAVGSIINNITFGYRYGKVGFPLWYTETCEIIFQEREDEFQRIKKLGQFFTGQFGNPLFRFMENDPEFYKQFPICGSYYNKIAGKVEEMKTFFFGLIDEHQKSIDFDSSEDPTDFVEAYLRHQHKLKIEGNGEENDFE